MLCFWEWLITAQLCQLLICDTKFPNCVTCAGWRCKNMVAVTLDSNMNCALFDRSCNCSCVCSMVTNCSLSASSYSYATARHQHHLVLNFVHWSVFKQSFQHLGLALRSKIYMMHHEETVNHDLCMPCNTTETCEWYRQNGIKWHAREMRCDLLYFELMLLKTAWRNASHKAFTYVAKIRQGTYASNTEHKFPLQNRLPELAAAYGKRYRASCSFTCNDMPHMQCPKLHLVMHFQFLKTTYKGSNSILKLLISEHWLLQFY